MLHYTLTMGCDTRMLTITALVTADMESLQSFEARGVPCMRSPASDHLMGKLLLVWGSAVMATTKRRATPLGIADRSTTTTKMRA